MGDWSDSARKQKIDLELDYYYNSVKHGRISNVPQGGQKRVFYFGGP